MSAGGCAGMMAAASALRVANKSTFGRVTGPRGEMLYEIETRGPVIRPSP